MSMTHDEMIAVIQGFKDGKIVEARWRNTPEDEWKVVSPPSWDFYHVEFRIRPEPLKPREFWLVEGFGGSTCDLCGPFKSEAAAVKSGSTGHISHRVIHVREVLPQ